MIKEKFRVFNKLLPTYEDICLDWFSQTKGKKNEEKREKEEKEEEVKEDE